MDESPQCGDNGNDYQENLGFYEGGLAKQRF